MINDEKIDLTERRDFGTSGLITEIGAFERDSLVDFAYSGGNMTNDEYEALTRYERVFGRRRHFNEWLDVFRKDEREYFNEMRTHCYRCGKEIRVPWLKRYDLCPECDRYVAGRIPWKDRQLVSFGSDRTMDVFSLR